MSDLIDRTTLPVWHEYVDGEGKYCYIIYKADLDAAPTIDVVPVAHARWIPTPSAVDNVYTCSACGDRHYQNPKFKRCPECGAFMDANAPEVAP